MGLKHALSSEYCAESNARFVLVHFSINFTCKKEKEEEKKSTSDLSRAIQFYFKSTSVLQSKSSKEAISPLVRCVCTCEVHVIWLVKSAECTCPEVRRAISVPLPGVMSACHFDLLAPVLISCDGVGSLSWYRPAAVRCLQNDAGIYDGKKALIFLKGPSYVNTLSVCGYGPWYSRETIMVPSDGHNYDDHDDDNTIPLSTLPSLLTPFDSVLVSISVFIAFSTVFHSTNSPDNSRFLTLLFRS